MKYSVRGRLNVSEGSLIVSLLNTYDLINPKINQTVNKQGKDILLFDVWLNTINEKDSLFESLKPFVDEFSGLIDWHECTHDQLNSIPCNIAEIYEQGG